MVIPHLMRDPSQRPCAAAKPFLSALIRCIRVPSLVFLSISTITRVRGIHVSKYTHNPFTSSTFPINSPTPSRSFLLRYSFVPSSFRGTFERTKYDWDEFQTGIKGHASSPSATPIPNHSNRPFQRNPEVKFVNTNFKNYAKVRHTPIVTLSTTTKQTKRLNTTHHSKNEIHKQQKVGQKQQIIA